MNKRLIYFSLVLIGFGTYIYSLFSPLITVKKLLIFNETISLVSVLSTLLSSNEIFLFIIIFVFTIILPLAKFILLLFYGGYPGIEKSYRTSFMCLEQISKWAMLDVFVAALLIVIIKMGFLSSSATHYGLYLFVFSVLLSIFCSQSRHYWLTKTEE